MEPEEAVKKNTPVCSESAQYAQPVSPEPSCANCFREKLCHYSDGTCLNGTTKYAPQPLTLESVVPTREKREITIEELQKYWLGIESVAIRQYNDTGDSKYLLEGLSARIHLRGITEPREKRLEDALRKITRLMAVVDRLATAREIARAALEES
jgi:hypothetical protein